MNDMAPPVLREATGLPDQADMIANSHMLHRLALTAGVLTLLFGVVQGLGQVRLAPNLLHEIARAQVAVLPLTALLASLAGIGAAGLLAGARRNGDAQRVAHMARWPQALLTTPLALLVAAVALLPRFALVGGAAPLSPDTGWLCGGALIGLAFPLLIAERVLAACPPSRLPEAPGLRALLFLPTILLPAAGVLAIAAGLGAPVMAARLAETLSLLPCVIAAELAVRAIGRCFLPPPLPDDARAVESTLARLLAEGTRARSLAEPLRQHLGIDFARSWALAYVRAAFAPLLLVLAFLGWGLSGVATVPLDQRAIYERFGAPAGVLQPGLHLVLPWPFGRLRPVEFGTIHEAGLAGDIAASRTRAEEPPPVSADRLWERAHPNEGWFLIAAARDGRQSFHLVNADIRLFYRIGLGDADAMNATYRVADPLVLLRRNADRVIAAFFAGHTLNAVLGENRETMAGRLRTLLQADLDAAGSGLDLTAVIIDAIHPPGGAADAYHAVQAAQINADASITAERGKAHARLSDAQQTRIALEADSAATAAELHGAATADATRFAAERDAAAGARDLVLFERRLAGLLITVPNTDVIIIDHRIPAADAPLIDMRAPPAEPVDAALQDREH